jgi:hypothetical protein
MLSLAKSTLSIENRLDHLEKLLELLLAKEVNTDIKEEVKIVKQTRTIATQTISMLSDNEFKELLKKYHDYGFQGEPKNPETMKNAIRQVESLYPDAVELGYIGTKNMCSLRGYFREKAKGDGVWDSILQKNNKEYRTIDEKVRDYYLIEALYSGALALGYNGGEKLKDLKKFLETKAKKDGIWDVNDRQYIRVMSYYIQHNFG